MSCKDCRNWQGRDGEWGDCNWVLGCIMPLLYYEQHSFKEGIYLRFPFDPHDVKYFDPILRRVLVNCTVPDGVRKDIVREDDLVFDDFGGERIAKVKVVYFQTHRDYQCEREV